MPSNADKLADLPAQSHDAELEAADVDMPNNDGSGLAQVLSTAKSNSVLQAPLRSDQVANAIAFLSNSKVVVCSLIATSNLADFRQMLSR